MTDTSRSDDALSGAKALNLSSGRTVFRDRVGGGDPRDFLKVQLNQRSQLTLSAKSQRSNARFVLLDGLGRTLRRLSQPQKGAARLQQTLDPGTYHIRVAPRQRSRNTKYRLVLNAQPVPGAATSLSRSPAAASSSGVDKSRFNIRFDYRFDTIGWFTPEKRAALEAAARVWENIIMDDFPEVPAGTRTYGLMNPQTGSLIREGVVNNSVIDDLVIYVGARELGFSGSAYAKGGAILAQAAPGGSRETRITGDQFRPWSGAIAFDLDSGTSPTSWFFDPTPDTANDIPLKQVDFISTAVHEIGHVLGFGTSQAFDRLTASINPAQSSEKGFVGINAKTVNGGSPIPLSGGHIRESYAFGSSGEAVMDVKIASGVRTLPNRLDIAILNDIGYTVNYAAAAQNSTTRTSQRAASSTLSSGLNRLLDSAELGYQCGCGGCLMGKVG